jgi:hypothetical protein
MESNANAAVLLLSILLEPPTDTSSDAKPIRERYVITSSVTDCVLMH